MNLASMPKVSIITAVLNQADELESTIKSVVAQDYSNLEFIVIDGGSRDRTLSVIKKYLNVISDYISEKDQGISDAFNKGLKLATGTYINFQGAGDEFKASNVISSMMEGVEERKDILVSGRVLRVCEGGIRPLWVAPKKYKKNFNKRQLLFKMPLPHQGLFTHKKFFEEYGIFDKSVKFAMDYELLLRAYHNFPKTILKDIVVATWRAGGVGKNRIDEIYDEYLKIKIKHNVAPKYLLNIIDKYNRAKFAIKSSFQRDKNDF